jgi:hypothetical protein
VDDETIDLVVDLCEALECFLYPQFGAHADPKSVNDRALKWIDQYAMDQPKKDEHGNSNAGPPEV